MGKTKTNRNLNPADAQRKLDRKRDIKRCKKQRVEVRKAVLKNKDPDTLIEQMTKIDEMAYDAHNKPPLPPRVMDEKRQRLRETIIKMLAMYKRDEEWTEFNKVRAQLRDYDLKKRSMEESYEAVKFAKTADPNSIPMPDGMMSFGAAMTPVLEPSIAQHVPRHLLLPDALPPVGILKRHQEQRKAPGPPIGLPPEFSDSEGEEEDAAGHSQPRGVRFADATVDAIDNEIMEKDGRAAGYKRRDDAPLSADRFAHPPPPPPMGYGQQNALLALEQQQQQMQQLQQQQQRVINPNRQPLGPSYRAHSSSIDSGAVISAAPSIHRAIGPSVPSAAPVAPVIPQQPANSQMFQSKAVMRNMRAEVTKLVPTSVNVKRNGGGSRPLTMKMTGGGAASRGFAAASSQHAKPAGTRQKPMTDDAYAQFMNEMKDLL